MCVICPARPRDRARLSSTCASFTTDELVQLRAACDLLASFVSRDRQELAQAHICMRPRVHAGATSLADRRRVDDVQTGPTTVVDEEVRQTGELVEATLLKKAPLPQDAIPFFSLCGCCS
eukprot:5111584-Pleurochrysis_carterae.AAC.1